MPRLGESALLAAVVLLAGSPATVWAQSPGGPAASAPPSAAALARATSQSPGTPTAASPTAAPTTQAVREEIDAQRIPGGPSPYQSRALHARLAELESALNALRVPEQPYP